MSFRDEGGRAYPEAADSGNLPTSSLTVTCYYQMIEQPCSSSEARHNSYDARDADPIGRTSASIHVITT